MATPDNTSAAASADDRDWSAGGRDATSDDHDRTSDARDVRADARDERADLRENEGFSSIPRRPLTALEPSAIGRAALVTERTH